MKGFITITNCIALIAWATLAIVFNKWWIAFFAILFMGRRRYYRFCDNCGKHSPYANSKEEALAKAKGDGWIHNADDDTDICPRCQKDIDNK